MANFIPQQVLDEITTKNDIVDVISSYVQLKKNGNRYSGLCPFHREKTPSFSVSEDKQLFHCFGCGAGGTVIHFIMRAENLDFIDAVKFLANRAGIVIPEREFSPSDQKAHDLRQTLYEINREAAKFYYKQLVGDTCRVSHYLKKRNLTKSSIVKFGLGVAPESWDGLYKYLLSKKFTEEQLITAGLIMKGPKGVADKFRSRLMFPIFDVRGSIVGFGGRALGDFQPKYLNSPQTPVFDKSHNLYAYQIAKNSKESYFLLAEGYMDVISLHQYGFDSAVASLGTAFTTGQAQLMKKYKNEVIICYDSDEAGVKATLRAIDILVGQGMAVRILSQSRAKDPDEYLVNYGPDEFRVELSSSMHYVDFKIHLLKQKYDLSNLDDKVKFLNGAARVLKDVTNLVEREVYVNKISEGYGVSKDALEGEISKLVHIGHEQQKRHIIRQQQAPASNPQAKTALENAERLLLALLIQNSSLLAFLEEDLKTGSFSREAYQKVFAYLTEAKKSQSPVNAAAVANALPVEDASLVAELFGANLAFDDDRTALMQLSGKIREERRKQLLLQLARSGDTEGSNDILHSMRVSEDVDRKLEP